MGGKKSDLLKFKHAAANWGVGTLAIKPLGPNSLEYLDVPYKPIASYKNWTLGCWTELGKSVHLQ